MSEPAVTAVGLVEFIDLDKLDVFDRLDDQLRDSLTSDDLEILTGIGIDEQHLQLTPVARVDQAGGVQTGHTVFQRQTAAGLDESRKSRRNCDRHACGDQGPAATGGQGDVLTRTQIDSCVARFRVLGKWQLRVHTEDFDVQHSGEITGRRQEMSLTARTLVPVLAWMDLEMTGLDATKDVIVEIATLITDDELNIIAEGPDLVVHATDEQLEMMEPVVVAMHKHSGLTEEIRSSTITLEEAGAATLAFLQEHIPEAGKVPLCGNSIGMDRRFLTAYLPEIEEFLHYRSIDVSTIKELARRWYPEDLAGYRKKSSAHRAMDDIKESVAEMRYWREKVFRAPTPAADGDTPEDAAAQDPPVTTGAQEP